MKHQPGDVLATTRRGVTITYSPSMGSTTRYRIACSHHRGVNARTLADAREAASMPFNWCPDCADERADA